MKAYVKIVLAVFLLLRIVSANEHAPVWIDGQTITYNIRDLDNFAPLSYERTRWGNVMDDGYDSTELTLAFSPLTEPHAANNTDQDTWDLFLSTDRNDLSRVFFPQNTSWDWLSGEVTMDGGDFYLFRYLHFDSTLQDPDANELPGNAAKVIVLIHGWNRSQYANPYAHEEFSELYSNLQNATASTDWTVFRYDWAADADTGDYTLSATDSTEAAEHGHQHGQHLGDTLFARNPGLLNVHLIAHSAGSWVARGAARNLLDRNPNIRVQVTLLDPYMPNVIWFNNSSLGTEIMSALDNTLQGTALFRLENYFSNDFTPGTQEVFYWNPTIGLNFQTDQSGAPTIYYGHDGPTQWYADTVRDATSGPVSDLMGYDLAT